MKRIGIVLIGVIAVTIHRADATDCRDSLQSVFTRLGFREIDTRNTHRVHIKFMDPSMPGDPKIVELPVDAKAVPEIATQRDRLLTSYPNAFYRTPLVWGGRNFAAGVLNTHGPIEKASLHIWDMHDRQLVEAVSLWLAFPDYDFLAFEDAGIHDISMDFHNGHLYVGLPGAEDWHQVSWPKLSYYFMERGWSKELLKSRSNKYPDLIRRDLAAKVGASPLGRVLGDDLKVFSYISLEQLKDYGGLSESDARLFELILLDQGYGLRKLTLFDSTRPSNLDPIASPFIPNHRR